MPVRIVTDSTAGLSPELCDSLGIRVVPLTVHFGTETFVDGIDPVAQFYAKLATADRPPTSSTPAPGTFFEIYRDVAAAGDPIISIHLMTTKSAVVSTAKMAAEMLPDSAISIVDSGTTSLALGLMAVAAARLASQGKTVSEILPVIAQMVRHTALHVAIADLTQLRKSGRVSLTQALMGGLLGIKPILYLGQGAADVVDRIRSWARAVDRVVEMAAEHAGPKGVALAVIHTNAAAEAEAVAQVIRQRFHVSYLLVGEAGPTLATHAGSGAIGVITRRLVE